MTTYENLPLQNHFDNNISTTNMKDHFFKREILCPLITFKNRQHVFTVTNMSSWNKDWPFIWRKLYPLYPKTLCLVWFYLTLLFGKKHIPKLSIPLRIHYLYTGKSMSHHLKNSRLCNEIGWNWAEKCFSRKNNIFKVFS